MPTIGQTYVNPNESPYGPAGTTLYWNGSSWQTRPISAPTVDEALPVSGYDTSGTRIGSQTPTPLPEPPNTPPDTAISLASLYTPEYFNSLRTSLGGEPPLITAPSATNQFTAQNPAPVPVTGLPDSYYSSQREGLKEALRQEFFGPLGTVQQVASGESAAGRLGSGVGKRVIEQAALLPFATGATQIDRNVMQAQAEEQTQLRQFNAQQQTQYRSVLATLMAADSSNALEASKAQATLKQDYNRLLATLADAEAGRLSQEAIAQLEADVRIYEAASKEHALSLGYDVDLINAQINYLNSIGQYKPVEGTVGGDVAGNLAGRFG